jgi:hypothetical protein
MTQAGGQGDEDFVTIIGSDVAQIIGAFQAQGLAEQEFSILHKIGRHRFTIVGEDGSSPMFEGRSLVAATFARRPRG